MSITGVSTGYNDDSPLLKANKAEREADDRIAQANARVQQAEREGSQVIDKIHNENDQERIQLSSKQEAAVEQQKTHGYEALRDLKNSQQALLRKEKREGDSENNKLNEYYRTLTYRTAREGETQLLNTQRQQTKEKDYNNQVYKMEEDQIRTENTQRLDQLRKGYEDQVQRLTDANKIEYDQKKETAEAEQERITQNLDARYKKMNEDRQEQLNKTAFEASENIRGIRQDTADKLAAYRTRQRDPFYRLVNVDADLTEERDAFVLRARVPDYEQEHLSAAVKGENLVINGFRRNEEKIEDGGHAQGTSSFQSFYESFPLSWPVDANRMTREFRGDEVIIRVPKKNKYAFKEPEQPKPSLARVEPPHFPNNIPHIRHHHPDEDEDKKPIDRAPGSGTLS